jgi:glycosyltransferase involved in cell wall biosynthesis
VRILFIMHMQWTRDAGAPRVAVELADELERLGHQVDHFDLPAAFPRRNRLSSFFEQPRFPTRAVRHVREYGNRYDVIHAEQGNLPVDKKSLGFAGTLVARSSGLVHFYEAYEQQDHVRQGEPRPPGSWAGNALRRWARRWADTVRNVDRSFAAADVILLNNEDERRYAAEVLGHPAKSVNLPNGLSDARLAQLNGAAGDPAARLAKPRVVFIGHWSRRKGSGDLPRIVARVRSAVPTATFLFAGTYVSEAEIRACMAPADAAAVQVVPTYRSDELPSLLAGGTVGLLPSAIEGFGIGVLESLAAGIPTVAYRVPGPKEMLTRFTRPMMAPVGDADGLADLTSGVLTLEAGEFADLCRESEAVATRFKWSDAVHRLLAAYEGRPVPEVS